MTITRQEEAWHDELSHWLQEQAAERARLLLAAQRASARQRLLLWLFAVLDWVERAWRPRVRPIILSTKVLEATPTGLLVSSDTQPNMEPIQVYLDMAPVGDRYPTPNEAIRFLEEKHGAEKVARIGVFEHGREVTARPALPQPTGGKHRPENQQADTVVLRTARGWCRYGDPAQPGAIIHAGRMYA